MRYSTHLASLELEACILGVHNLDEGEYYGFDVHLGKRTCLI